jgi:hypothetical protein
MSTKWTVVISVAWVVVVMVACVAFVIYQTETRAWPRYESDERAAALGQPAAIFTCVTLAPLWVYWGVKRRQRLAR